MKKNKKIILIVSIVVLAIIIIAGIGLFVNDLLQKSTFSKEIAKINATQDVDTTIRSSGKYGEVEKALKDYVVEYQGIIKDMQNAYANEKFTTILSADNVKEDGPNFEQSQKLINDVKTKSEETKTKLAEMLTDEYKEKRATDSGLSGKYKDLFKDSVQLGEEVDDLNTIIDNSNQYLDKINDVFTFLKENQNSWSLNNNKVEFTDMSKLIKYNSLITLVNTAARTLAK